MWIGTLRCPTNRRYDEAVTPNFFLVGTTKGGTSSLDLWLRRHPDVATPARKEMHFFCRCPNPKLRAADTRDAYLAAFPPARAVGESSPCYLYYPDIPMRLAEFPGSRIVVSLRDPAERFWSHHLMNEIYRPSGLTAEGVLERNLADGRSNALEDLFGMGLYGEQMARYSAVFGPERILVLFLEETAPEPDAAMRHLQVFLGLDPKDLDTSARDKQHVEPRGPMGRILLRNPKMRRIGNAVLSPSVRRFLKTRVLGDPDAKPSLPSDLRQRLETLYSPDSLRLEQLIGRPLPWGWHR